MRVKDDCVRGVNINKRRFGYLHICCDNVHERNHLYWGEVEVRHENTKASFCYMIDFLDTTKRYYRLKIFSDREFKRQVTEGHVAFKDSGTRDLKVHKADGSQFVPDELWSLMHMIIYERIIDQILPSIRGYELRASSDEPLGGIMCLFGFHKSLTDEFFQETFVNFEILVANLNLVIG